MAGYTRQSTIADGNTIDASLFNNEYNQLLAAFVNTSGHKHDGTAAEGPVISILGDAGLVTPLNKILVDSTNNHIEFYVDVSSSAVEQLRIQDGAIVPITDNDIDLGTSSLEFKDAYFDGNVTLDGLVIGSATAITDVDTDLTSVSASDDTVASAKAIKTYVDAQVGGADLDFSGDSGGAQSVDLDAQTLTLTGGTGIDTTGSAQTMTFAIDSTVATLTGSQTLTNKTLEGCSLVGTLNTLTNIPNNSLINSQITVNGTPIALGGAVTTPDNNTTYAISAQDGAGAAQKIIRLTSGGNAGAGVDDDVTLAVGVPSSVPAGNKALSLFIDRTGETITISGHQEDDNTVTTIQSATGGTAQSGDITIAAAGSSTISQDAASKTITISQLTLIRLQD